jgi:hypothetical protein
VRFYNNLFKGFSPFGQRQFYVFLEMPYGRQEREPIAIRDIERLSSCDMFKSLHPMSVHAGSVDASKKVIL